MLMDSFQERFLNGCWVSLSKIINVYIYLYATSFSSRSPVQPTVSLPWPPPPHPLQPVFLVVRDPEPTRSLDSSTSYILYLTHWCRILQVNSVKSFVCKEKAQLRSNRTSLRETGSGAWEQPVENTARAPKSPQKTQRPPPY